MITRREFIAKSTYAASLLPFSALAFQSSILEQPDDMLDVNIFSKHLQFLDYKTTGEMAAEMGFSGVDLTVRPKGHVLPELVKTDLPIAVKAIKASGINCNMITTSIESVFNPLDVDILEAASKERIIYYRTNWFKFKKDISMHDSLLIYQSEIKKLGELNKKLRLVGCYQNHAGTNVGASYWEIKTILEDVNKEYFGTQYDIRHAMVEGGYSWENGFQLLHPNMKVIVLKDFKWAQVNGKWEAINVPIGEGMVDFIKYFKLLKQYKLKPPVSLHLEYDLGGAEKGNAEISIDKKLVFDAMKKDLKSVQQLWKKHNAAKKSNRITLKHI
ncbi:sugar phosphate isomerase/epimerase family protein [Siansivirga zeaxanthinifaciens]|uniref:Endonuclease n=1 Tax=Siansivirga zeaxanthinifaciens CC-SAMT-1 TaxID=1454006 RepID=A0A0C5WN99_9FLAO|nr:TIM barrel protein [Siansivirga zeaxanthinifaciens]AJR04355.1 endonuclease [Siansivirga zeaxanthinifaciens CC-SAMT-1]